MEKPSWMNDRFAGLDPSVLGDMERADDEIRWIRESTADDLLALASKQLGTVKIESPFRGMNAVELGNLRRADLLEHLEERFEAGTTTAEDLADQIQLSRAFADPRAAAAYVADEVARAVTRFPSSAESLKVGHNRGDVLDPFILAANFELLSDRNMEKTIEAAASHKVLMKVEDLVGNLHQNVIGRMRGNFRIPEPQGSRTAGKEKLDRMRNPFPGADVGQAPIPARPDALRLFQVKSKTGSAKGGDGKRLGEQLRRLEETYEADTFYAAVVGNTLTGHRSRGAVQRESPSTAVLVGEAALDELTQSSVGGELLLRVYQRAFRAAAKAAGYDFGQVLTRMHEVFQQEADEAGEDFLSAWLHNAIGGPPSEQDSRQAPGAGRAG
jgi:hypothetical protein